MEKHETPSIFWQAPFAPTTPDALAELGRSICWRSSGSENAPWKRCAKGCLPTLVTGRRVTAAGKWWGNQNMQKLGSGLISPWQGVCLRHFVVVTFFRVPGWHSGWPGVATSSRHASSRRTPWCYWRCWTERLASAAKPGWGVTWMADRPERPTWHWPGLRGVGFEETVGLPMVAL